MHTLWLVALLLMVSPLAFAGDEDYFDAHTIRASDLPKNPPEFERFPAAHRFLGEPVVPDTRSHPRSRMFRTVIRNAAKSGPNFAGHYTIIRWGCGTGCIQVAIVDARNGKVFHPPNLASVDNENVAYEELEDASGNLMQFNISSTLLIVIGGINEAPNRRGISYFVWEREKLRRVLFVPKPYR